MRKPEALIVFASVALLAAACGNWGQSSAPTTGKITFISDRDGNHEIYSMNADGSGLTNLTSNPAEDFLPAWSPDGTHIAFVSSRDGNGEIYVMEADGSGLTNLTNDPVEDAFPAWSPDGARIAFTSFPDDGEPEINVINADGSGLTHLAEGSGASWSPDGSRIAFGSTRNFEPPGDTYLVNADGSGLTHLGEGGFSAWSPDGSRLAGLILCCGGIVTGRGIDIINADGTGRTKVATGGESGPLWSPDGSRLVFTSRPDDVRGSTRPSTTERFADIYVMNADGSVLTNLTSESAFPDTDPAWSPDGSRIAFVSFRDGNEEIYVMDADGSNLTRLTDSPGRDRYPVWSPP